MYTQHERQSGTNMDKHKGINRSIHNTESTTIQHTSMPRKCLTICKGTTCSTSKQCRWTYKDQNHIVRNIHHVMVHTWEVRTDGMTMSPGKYDTKRGTTDCTKQKPSHILALHRHKGVCRRFSSSHTHHRKDGDSGRGSSIAARFQIKSISFSLSKDNTWQDW